MLKEFKRFILRGNVVDLAVGVIIGAAFGAVVTSLVKDVITPLISALVHIPKFSKLEILINGTAITYGNFLDALIAFLTMATVVFFFVVQPVNRLVSRMQRGEEKPEPTTRQCPECLSDVPKAAKRCAFCTTKLTPQAEAKA